MGPGSEIGSDQEGRSWAARAQPRAAGPGTVAIGSTMDAAAGPAEGDDLTCVCLSPAPEVCVQAQVCHINYLPALLCFLFKFRPSLPPRLNIGGSSHSQ